MLIKYLLQLCIFSILDCNDTIKFQIQNQILQQFQKPNIFFIPSEDFVRCLVTRMKVPNVDVGVMRAAHISLSSQKCKLTVLRSTNWNNTSKARLCMGWTSPFLPPYRSYDARHTTLHLDLTQSRFLSPSQYNIYISMQKNARLVCRCQLYVRPPRWYFRVFLTSCYLDPYWCFIRNKPVMEMFPPKNWLHSWQVLWIFTFENRNAAFQMFFGIQKCNAREGRAVNFLYVSSVQSRPLGTRMVWSYCGFHIIAPRLQ